MLLLRTTTKPLTLFNGLLDELFMFPFEPTSTMQPIYDVIENDNEYITHIQLAGIKKEDTSISVDKDQLIIKAERKGVKDVEYNHKQSFTGMYQKTFTLPDTVDKDNIQASFADGILTVVIPKTKKQTEPEKKQIPIK